MRCYRVKKKLKAFLDNELDDAQRKKIETHLIQCERCSKELEELKRVWDLLSELPSVEQCPDITTKVFSKLEEKRGLFSVFGLKKAYTLSFALASFIVFFIGIIGGIEIGRFLFWRLNPSVEIQQQSSLEAQIFQPVPSQSIAWAYIETILEEKGEENEK